MLKNRQKQIVVGMSGGVDSSLSLVLLKEQGWRPVGVSLKYAAWKNKENLLRENVCCNAASFKIAAQVCKKLDVPYHIFKVAKNFKKEVIDYFLAELKNNKTPNPCIICNRYLKFKYLFDWASKHDIKYVATGHYAKTKKNSRTRKYELLRARDKNKDQTYSLSFLTQAQLKNIIFPLGDYTKSEIYKLAEKNGFKIFLKKKQSQDFCFVAGKSIELFLKKEIGERPGEIKDERGNILGYHSGLHFYTIGQRRGINLSGGPYFVIEMDAKNNVLIVSKNREDLYSKEAILSPLHFISIQAPKQKIKIKAKIRSRHASAEAVLMPISKNKMKLKFKHPQKAITPGQFAVFYEKDICLGGGNIV